eukprot:gene9149-biopygen21207
MLQSVRPQKCAPSAPKGGDAWEKRRHAHAICARHAQRTANIQLIFQTPYCTKLRRRSHHALPCRSLRPILMHTPRENPKGEPHQRGGYFIGIFRFEPEVTGVARRWRNRKESSGVGRSRAGSSGVERGRMGSSGVERS